jgi:hypothetical protein
MHAYVWVIVLIATGIVISIVLEFALKGHRKIVTTTRQAALDSLPFLQEWAKWMSGIETAVIAALAIFVLNEDKCPTFTVVPVAKSFALATFLLMGLALLSSAWILSALPSLSLRIRAETAVDPSPAYDVYEMSLYGWLTPVRLAYVMWLQHWAWGAALVTFAIFICIQLI